MSWITQKKFKRWLLPSAVVLGSAAFAYHTFGHSAAPKPAPFHPTLKQNGEEIVVRAFTISDQAAKSRCSSFTGTIEARFAAPVGFRIPGKILQRNVIPGMRIRKGEVLFRLDPVDYDLQLRLAESELASAEALVLQAKAEEVRLRELVKSRSVSQSDYDVGLSEKDVAIARVDAAKKRLDLAKNQRDYCELTADSDGLVLAVQGEAGQVVPVGQPVLTLMQGDELEALISLPETQLGTVNEMTPFVTLWANEKLRIPAKLRELSPIADPMTRTFDARFSLLSSDGVSMPDSLSVGLTATVHLTCDAQGDISVPQTAIAHQENQTIVWRIDPSSGSIESVQVDVIRYGNELATVRGDLNTNDQIVSAGVQRLDSAVRVRVWKGN
ncbi:MAG: efflux RND transporter periplasmic adaptor subunit [Pirellula sp.]|nr:efflux RND transporter periplasmic adaptor subunit [Pirellula sp.]